VTPQRKLHQSAGSIVANKDLTKQMHDVDVSASITQQLQEVALPDP